MRLPRFGIRARDQRQLSGQVIGFPPRAEVQPGRNVIDFDVKCSQRHLLVNLAPVGNR